jgi:hypothetical protein
LDSRCAGELDGGSQPGVVVNCNGKVRSIRLIETAGSHAQLIGPPSDVRALRVKFTHNSRLDILAIVWEHHPRSCDYRQ